MKFKESLAVMSIKRLITIACISIVAIVVIACVPAMRGGEYGNLTEGVNVPQITPAKMLENGGIELVGYGIYEDNYNHADVFRMNIKTCESYKDKTNDKLGIPVELTVTSMWPCSDEIPEHYIGYINLSDDRLTVFYPGNSHDIFFKTSVKNMAEFEALLYNKSRDESGVFRFYEDETFKNIFRKNVRNYVYGDYDIFGSEPDEIVDSSKSDEQLSLAACDDEDDIRKICISLLPVPKGYKNVKAIVWGSITGYGWVSSDISSAVLSNNEFYIPCSFGFLGELIDKGCNAKLTEDKITIGDMVLNRAD